MPRHSLGTAALVAAVIVLGATVAACQPFWTTLREMVSAPATPTPRLSAPAVLGTAVPPPGSTPSRFTPAPTLQPAASPTVTTAPATATPQRLPVEPPATMQPMNGQPTATSVPVPGAQPTPVPDVLTDADQIAQAASDGLHGVPFELTISQDEIAQEMTTYLENNPDIAINDTQVTLTPGAGIVTGKAQIARFSVPFKATLTVEVVDGRPRLRVLQLDVLGGLIPGFIKDQLIALIEQNADLPIAQDLPVTITDVEIQQGQVVARGTLN